MRAIAKIFNFGFPIYRRLARRFFSALDQGPNMKKKGPREQQGHLITRKGTSKARIASILFRVKHSYRQSVATQKTQAFIVPFTRNHVIHFNPKECWQNLLRMDIEALGIWEVLGCRFSQPMGREQKRRQEARKAKQLVQSGKAERRPCGVLPLVEGVHRSQPYTCVGCDEVHVECCDLQFGAKDEVAIIMLPNPTNPP